MKELKVGIVGCGAIGSSLAKAVIRDFKGHARVSALFDIDPEKSKILSRSISGDNKLVVDSLKGLIDRSSLLIEASSANASLKIAEFALKHGKDVLVMSVGGIIESCPRLMSLARANKANLYIPSGALSGIDALKSAGSGRIQKVTLTTTKNPISFKGVRYIMDRHIDLTKIRHAKVIFSGSAREAVKYFPQNINVAALVSIAGIGAKHTRVRIIASPFVKRNIHELEVVSSSGRIYTRTENVLHPDNPKTSYLAYLSAVRVLKQILEPVKIGT